jgi:16S rRNA (cytidine1402-2'-O)-methyltransferase
VAAFQQENCDSGILYVVSTPIGNLADMSLRAIETLKDVALVAAEDTRHSVHLLNHFAIDTPLMAYHDHSDERSQKRLIDTLLAGQSVALISDAGTPLIADPGYKLVRQARASGIQVVPVPGASALLAALAASGLPTDRFTFEGFMPAKSEQRKRYLDTLARESRTMVFYESPHRILSALEAMTEAFGSQRLAVIGRELTKRFETFVSGSLSEILQKVGEDKDQQRGEFVVILQGYNTLADETDQEREAYRIIRLIHEELTPKQAASIAAKITGISRKEAYNMVLSCQGKLKEG